MKIDNSWLQTGALVVIGMLLIMAAIDSRWDIVGTGLVGMFAVLNIHPKSPPGAPDA